MTRSALTAGAAGVALICAVLGSGCAETIQMRFHEPVDVGAFGKSLIVGKSTREDVLAVLGVPSGRGRAMLPIDPEPRTVWFYTYSEATVSMTGGKGMLDSTVVFVYFKGDVYDGSMYGSSFLK